MARGCDEARAAGYTRICLDTLPTMQVAIALYRGLGFDSIPRYYDNPIACTVYLGMTL